MGSANRLRARLSLPVPCILARRRRIFKCTRRLFRRPRALVPACARTCRPAGSAQRRRVTGHRQHVSARVFPRRPTPTRVPFTDGPLARSAGNDPVEPPGLHQCPALPPDDGASTTHAPSVHRGPRPLASGPLRRATRMRPAPAKTPLRFLAWASALRCCSPTSHRRWSCSFPRLVTRGRRVPGTHA